MQDLRLVVSMSFVVFISSPFPLSISDNEIHPDRLVIFGPLYVPN